MHKTRKARIALVHTGSHFSLSTIADPALRAHDIAFIYAPEMTAQSLDGFDALYLAARNHPRIMAQNAPHVLDFLSREGVRAYLDGANGVSTWLPGASEEPRGTNFWSWRTGEDVGRRSQNKDHYLWNYLSDEALHWHYHGVLELPKGATSLVGLEVLADRHGVEGAAADGMSGAEKPRHTDPWGSGYLAIPGHSNSLLYYDDASFPAELVVSTMDATYHHGSGFMTGATQLLYRMLNWLADTPAAR